MAYGKIKADAIIRDNGGVDEEVTVATLIATGTGLANKADVTSPTITTPTLTSPTMTGSSEIPQQVGAVAAVAALDLDCSTSNYFTKTINANSTFTVSNVPATGSYSLTLELTHTSGTITWWSGVEWSKATAPTFTAGKTHLVMFVTDDGGTRWRGAALVDYNN